MALAKSASARKSEVRPVSSCRCKTRIDSIAVSNLRGTELTSVIHPPVMPERISLRQDHLPQILSKIGDHSPGDPPDPQDRCARLCRWLA
jgi:hypothetical protein